MGYRKSLEAAGAIVSEFAEFGDYQGSWFAVVLYKGQEGIVQGSYGSCSGCDAFQSEFDYRLEENTPEYNIKLKEFGESYLTALMTIDEALAYANKESSWDLESKEMIEWLDRLKIIKFNRKLEEIIK